MNAQLEELQSRLGHNFSNRDLLLRALTHKSLLADLPPATNSHPRDNEQFEFLDDSILGFLTSEHLLKQCPDYPEGKLSKLKAHLVSAAHLHEVAQALTLGSYLRLGHGEEVNGGRTKRALMANAMEALIAAVYLDAGMEEARGFLDRHIWNGLARGGLSTAPIPTDAKSELQELALARKLHVPRYNIVHSTGPEHSRTFTVEVRIGKDLTARAEGNSKKNASQKAARILLNQLQALSE